MYSLDSGGVIPINAPRPQFQSTRLLEQVRERVRYLHYSLRTEDAYLYWVRFFIRFHGLRHPREMAKPRWNASLPCWPRSARCRRPPTGRR